jgi:inorganic triphosphatase YgiF
LTRVEVEVAAGQASDPRVQGFVRQMEGSLGLRQARISKYEAGLFATGLSPEGWADLGSTGVDASLSLGELAFAVLRRQFAAMRAHEPGTRLGEDPEELHDMRVATRRMRAAIKIFQDALPERSRWLREELRHFAGVLGAVRDLDVHIEEVKGLSSGDGEEDEALAAVVASLERRRAEARGRMLEALDSERYARFESSFAGMLRRGPYVAGRRRRHHERLFRGIRRERARTGGGARYSRPALQQVAQGGERPRAELPRRGVPRPAEEGQAPALRH